MLHKEEGLPSGRSLLSFVKKCVQDKFTFIGVDILYERTERMKGWGLKLGA